MTESIKPVSRADVRYLLRIGDTCLVLAQRLCEWSGHAPILEEDIAMSNMALDLIGQARAVLTRAGQRNADAGGALLDEDQLAFLRDERDYLNCTIAELPRGDFAFSVLRNAMMATWFRLLWDGLRKSDDEELAAIAGKAIKEARYHQQHAADWVARLGDGTAESRRRMDVALDALWRFVPELFESDPVDTEAAAMGLGPTGESLKPGWQSQMQSILAQAGMALPEAESEFRSQGKRGVHTEHMGFMLAEMQTLQRSFPGGVW